MSDGENMVETEIPQNEEIQPEATTFEVPKMKPIEVKVTDYMKKALDTVAKNEGFVDYEYVVDLGCNVGDGFVGNIFKTVIQEKQSDKHLDVVVKVPPENEARRQQFNAMALFRRECILYNEILPKFADFQEEHRTKPNDGFFNFPHCYFAEFSDELDDSVIILEDLRLDNHKMWSKFIPMDLEHAKMVMESLGRLHAVSFALKRREPKFIDKITPLVDPMFKDLEDPRFFYFLGSMMDQAIGTLDENDTKRRNKLMTLKENILDVIKETTAGPAAEPYAVLTHGDCWTNNFMFKYRNKRPVKICFIDWQISRYSSPVLDIAYFIFNSTNHEMRVQHFDELIHIYHNSLKKLLNHLGGDTMSQFPLTALLRQLKMFGKYGIITACFLLPMLTTKNEDLPDMDFLAESFDKGDIQQNQAMEGLFKKSPGHNSYTERMRDVIIDCIKYGYL